MFDLGDKAILIIEDELELREVMLESFAGNGWKVRFSLSQDEILKTLGEVSSVLMDWHLPGLDSETLYRACRRARPCTVVTGDLDCPIPGVVMKPFKMEALIKTCDKALERAKKGLDLFAGDKVLSKASPEWGDGVVVDVYGDECWIQFPQAPKSVSARAIRCMRPHLQKIQ